MTLQHSLVALALAAPLFAQAQQAPANAQYDREGNVIYLEQPTPAGSIPPPNAVRPVTNPAPAPATAAKPDNLVVSRSQAPDRSGIRSGFEAAYRRAGAPRMAVYFNRELSDEVREWVPGDAVTTERTRTSTNKGSFEMEVDSNIDPTDNISVSASSNNSRTVKDSATTRSQQYIGVTGGRDDPRESYKWEFEDVVTNEFLLTRTNLVDRSMIFRLMAKQRPQKEGLSGSISTNLNETSALEKYADVLVELLVTEAPDTAVGYDFRATAKEIKTGRLVGTAYVRGSEPLFSPETRYVPGPTGFTRQTTRFVPTVSDVSSLLATRLMQSMTGAL